MLRVNQIDLLKGGAILAVIIIHSLSYGTMLVTGAPFHIWQAIPIFMVIAGYNSAISCSTSKYNIKSYYAINIIQRLLIPYFLIWCIQLLLIIYCDFDSAKDINIDDSLLLSFIAGGWGPGSYFVPVFIQHILFFPVIYAVFSVRKISPILILILIFSTCMVLEFLLVVIGLSSEVYRLIGIRYIFAVALGVVAQQFGFPRKESMFFLIAVLVSSIFIWLADYDLVQFSYFFISQWGSHHAPSYFFTLFVFMTGMRFLPSINNTKISSLIGLVGRASYHIFLVQMMWFWIIQRYSILKHKDNILLLLLNISVCCIIGLLYYLLYSMFVSKLNEIYSKIRRNLQNV